MYNEDNFLDHPRYENYDYLHGRVRKEDMGCAVLYAFGIDSFQKAQKIFPGTSFEDQVSTVLRAARRTPRYVADIGCGLGSLTALFLACGVKIDAVDPSFVSRDRVLDTIARFIKKPINIFEDRVQFFNIPLAAYMNVLKDASDFPDTFVLVETIEHIPKWEILSAVETIKAHGNCMLIVTNAVDYHPIPPDGTGWNHITLVDDAYYDELSQMAQRKVLRAGSHLVLEF